MSAITCDERRKLRDAVIAYMNGTISTYAFDDLNCECMAASDPSVEQIAKVLYQIHDDTVDHPISVTNTTWETLLRIVAFLGTDLAADENTGIHCWPFKGATEWHATRTNTSEINVPSYDPEIHTLPVHGPLNRIPTPIGLGIVVLTAGLLILLVFVAFR